MHSMIWTRHLSLNYKLLGLIIALKTTSFNDSKRDFRQNYCSSLSFVSIFWQHLQNQFSCQNLKSIHFILKFHQSSKLKIWKIIRIYDTNHCFTPENNAIYWICETFEKKKNIVDTTFVKNELCAINIIFDNIFFGIVNARFFLLTRCLFVDFLF